MRVLIPLLCFFYTCYAALVTHDATFVPDFVLVATAQQLNVDCTTRYSVVFNGTSPGPTLRLKEGRTTWIRVYNNVKHSNLTVHWHGISQRTAPFSDGTPLVAQWPIPSGYFFDYEVRPEVGDAGTYFYHSHIGFQQVSAHGALIVEDSTTPPYTYYQEKILTLGNYFIKNDSETESLLLADPVVWSGEANAILLNGHSGKANFSSKGASSCTPYIIDVEPGRKYRLRLIGASALTIVKMGFENHSNLTAIEADGEYTAPVTIDHIQVAPGQRFSYILQTKSASELQKLKKTHFWVRYESRDRATNTTGYALLRYLNPGEKAVAPTLTLPKVSPVTLPTITYNYLEYALTPYNATVRKSFPKLSEVTRTVTLQMAQKMASGKFVNGEFDGALDWATNGFAWHEEKQAARGQVPYIVDMYKSGKTPNYTLALENNGFDPISKTYPARVGEVLDIVWLQNGGPAGYYDSHPMHIHGEHVWDLGSGNGSYKASENEKRFAKFTPAKRDVTPLYRYNTLGVPYHISGWRAWRIRITEDNIGAWMAHCHIAQHAIMGMNNVWVYGNATQLEKKFPVLPYVKGYLEFGGSAYGRKGVDPVVNHYFDA